MESQIIIIVVHFNITLIFIDGFPNTFNAETMSVLIRFIGGKAALWIREWIFSAGVYDCYHDKWEVIKMIRKRNVKGGFWF